MEHQKTEDNKASFSAWVSDPKGIGFANSNDIESLVREFPYCQILQSLNAKAFQRQNPQSFNAVLVKTALYLPNRRVLFNLINAPEKLLQVENLQPPENEPYFEVIEVDDYSADLVSHDFEKLKPEEIVNNEGPAVHEGSESELVSEIELSEFETDFRTEELPETEKSSDQGRAFEGPDLDEEDRMIIENIAAADFFAFEEKLNLRQADDKDERPDQDETVSAKETEGPVQTNEISLYDDDQMPYSFLWWLHKTRNEHADTYQPYVNFKLDTSKEIKKKSGEELNQQIIENIFHLKSPLQEMENKPSPKTVHFEVKRKEEDIIEKFIREEPQIHPPSPDKLDMENKARKSAEDPNDLVSETLATIYTEQMLFHKAIDTYQKLSLKFPEKRAYFADQISELQKKIN